MCIFDRRRWKNIVVGLFVWLLKRYEKYENLKWESWWLLIVMNFLWIDRDFNKNINFSSFKIVEAKYKLKTVQIYIHPNTTLAYSHQMLTFQYHQFHIFVFHLPQYPSFYIPSTFFQLELTSLHKSFWLLIFDTLPFICSFFIKLPFIQSH